MSESQRSAKAENAVPGAQPPVEERGARVAEPPKSSAGLRAVVSAAEFSFGEMGVGRTLKTLSKLNQKDGFDCPSCAWPDPDFHRNIAEFCESGAKAVAFEATRRRLTPEVFAQHPISELSTWPDARFEDLGRITHPMLRRTGSSYYEAISWDAAFTLIADTLNRLESPHQAAFYTSGRASNEAAFLYGLFARQFGTNNLPDCSNMCHESSGTGLNEVIGIGKATIKLEDFADADAIFVIGQNPGTCHPRMLTELQKAARNGCKIISVNPLREAGLVRFRNPQEPFQMLGAGTELATLFLRVRVNGDVALLKGIMKAMLEEDDRASGKVLDHDFIAQRTEGFESFAEDLRAETWERIVRCSGVAEAMIRKGAAIAAESKRMICTWAMGITQHRNGVANVQSIVNLALLRGQIGRRGAGVCPVRGHSNVQGDRTVGIWEKMSDEFIAALGKEFAFAPPKEHGFDTVQTIEAMDRGEIGVFVGLGGNFLSATPDTNFSAKALQRCKLTVQVSTKLNRSHLVLGEQALILPCLGRTEIDMQKCGEQFVTVEDTTGVVHMSRGVLPPASEHLRSETAIIAGMAAATLGERSQIDWDSLVADYDLIRNHIEHVVSGFENYNERVRKPGGFYLPNAPREGTFKTKTGRAKFKVHPIPENDLAPNQLLLTTIRSHDQFNTTIYSENDRYRGISAGRRVVFLNGRDMERLGLAKEQWVDLVSHFDGEARRAARFKVVEYDIPIGCAAAYYPETNVLVPIRSVADGSNQPASKSVIISVEPSSGKRFADSASAIR